MLTPSSLRMTNALISRWNPLKLLNKLIPAAVSKNAGYGIPTLQRISLKIADAPKRMSLVPHSRLRTWVALLLYVFSPNIVIKMLRLML